MNLFNRSTDLTPWSSYQMKGSKSAELNISGFIGIPEWWQFDPGMEKQLISTKEKLQSELKAITEMKADKITVNIDSLGGDVNHGQAMRTALINNGAEVEVNYTGWAASIATIIASAATDNNITTSSTNLILIHEARGGAYGVSSAMRKSADMMDKINSIMADVYASQTGRAKDEVLAQMAVDNGEGEWMTASEAKEFGLVKYVNEPIKAAASYDTNQLKYFGYSIPNDKLKTIQMFGKKPSEPINMVNIEDGITLLYEGAELKAGIELTKVGETEAKLQGEYKTTDGATLKVDENNKVESFEAKVVEAAPAEMSVQEMIEACVSAAVEAVTPLIEEVQTSMTAKLDGLRKNGSTAVVPGTNFKQEEQAIDVQAQASAIARKKAKEIQEKKRKAQTD